MPKFINLNRKKIGKWRVLKYAGNSMWKCKCECGTRRDISGADLRNGKPKQCNACKVKSQRNKHIGQIYGYWKVLEYISTGRYVCECTRCKKEYPVYIHNLVCGKSKQCDACNLKFNGHGMSGTKYYRIWINCKTKNKFCERWASSFMNFYEDTFAGYSDGMHIIPINRNMVMSIDNYEWSYTWRSKGSALVKIGGTVMSKSEWARYYGITRQGFDYRVKTAKEKRE